MRKKKVRAINFHDYEVCLDNIHSAHSPAKYVKNFVMFH